MIKLLYGIETRPRNDRTEFTLLAVGTFKRFVLRFPIGARNGSEDLPFVSWILENERYAEFLSVFIRWLIDRGYYKKHPRTISIVVKMRNGKITSFFNECLILLGFKP